MYREILKSKALLADSNKKENKAPVPVVEGDWVAGREGPRGVKGRHEVSDRVDYLFPDLLLTKPQFDARKPQFWQLRTLFCSKVDGQTRRNEFRSVKAPHPKCYFYCPSSPPPHLLPFSPVISCWNVVFSAPGSA